MKRPTALTAAAASPGTWSGAAATSQTDSPSVLAWPTMRACEVLPMPRRGEFTTPLEADHVLRVHQQREVGQRVLDLGPLVEARAADDLVADAVAHEHVLEHAALRVGPVEDGDLVARAALVHEPLDLGHHEARLGVLVLELAHVHRLALAEVAPELLVLARAVVLDDRVGGREDRLRRAVVLLQLDDLGVGVVLLEVEDVADVGAAEAVDRLVVVADHRQVAVLLATAAAASGTGRGWCPGTRPPARAGRSAGSGRAPRGRARTGSRSGTAGRRSPWRCWSAPAARRARRRRPPSARRTTPP